MITAIKNIHGELYNLQESGLYRKYLSDHRVTLDWALKNGFTIYEDDGYREAPPAEVKQCGESKIVDVFFDLKTNPYESVVLNKQQTPELTEDDYIPKLVQMEFAVSGFETKTIYPKGDAKGIYKDLANKEIKHYSMSDNKEMPQEGPYYQKGKFSRMFKKVEDKHYTQKTNYMEQKEMPIWKNDLYYNDLKQIADDLMSVEASNSEVPSEILEMRSRIENTISKGYEIRRRYESGVTKEMVQDTLDDILHRLDKLEYNKTKWADRFFSNLNLKGEDGYMTVKVKEGSYIIPPTEMMDKDKLAMYADLLSPFLKAVEKDLANNKNPQPEKLSKLGAYLDKDFSAGFISKEPPTPPYEVEYENRTPSKEERVDFLLEKLMLYVSATTFGEERDAEGFVTGVEVKALKEAILNLL